jgi:phage shock protein PspC (stress-responsive transcriptional regulator)
MRSFFELQAFGVCTYLGDKMGIASSKIRLFFIYASFIAMGSPVIIYLTMAFLLNIKNFVRERINPVWDI